MNAHEWGYYSGCVTLALRWGLGGGGCTVGVAVRWGLGGGGCTVGGWGRLYCFLQGTDLRGSGPTEREIALVPPTGTGLPTAVCRCVGGQLYINTASCCVGLHLSLSLSLSLSLLILYLFLLCLVLKWLR